MTLTMLTVARRRTGYDSKHVLFRPKEMSAVREDYV
jgi:hypothetical protein